MNWIKKCLALAVAVVSVTSAFGQKTAVKGLMWKATSGATSIYLVGSIHLGSAKMYPLPSQYEYAFQHAKALVVEADINHIDQAKLLPMLQSDGMYSGDDNLFKHVSPATVKQIKKFCTDNGFQPEVFQMFKPWMASMMVEIGPMMKMGMQANLGVDEYFMHKAEKANKPVVEAESVDFQLKLLASTPSDEQDQMLAKALSSQDDAKKGTDKLVDEWISGDAAGIAKAVTSDKDSKVERRLLEDRNPHMADVAEGFLKKKEPCLFVVGAGHLVGNEGVVSILKQRGYTVTQVLGSIGP